MAFVMNYRARPTTPEELRQELFVVGSSFQMDCSLLFGSKHKGTGYSSIASETASSRPPHMQRSLTPNYVQHYEDV